MSAMDHPALLQRLIIASEMAMQMRYGADREAVIDLMCALEAEARKPVDRERVIGDAVVMCSHAVACADNLLRSQATRDSASTFVRVVGVLLPDVRGALEMAIEQRRRPTA